MRGQVLFLFSILLCTTSQGQWQDKIDSFRNAGIDTAFEYYNSHKHWIARDSLHLITCEYLLWSQNGNLNIQKHSFCLSKSGNPYEAFSAGIKFESDELFQFLVSNLDSILFQRVRPALVKGRIADKDTLWELRGNHSSYYSITLLTNCDTVRNSYSYDQLWDGTIRNDDGSFRARQEVLNYEFNNSTALVKFSRLLERVIDELDKKNAFKFVIVK